MAGRSVTVELPDELYDRLQRRAAREARRLESLHFKLQDEGLDEAERQEERALLAVYRRAMLVRAQALALLTQRGRDIAPLLVC